MMRTFAALPLAAAMALGLATAAQAGWMVPQDAPARVVSEPVVGTYVAEDWVRPAPCVGLLTGMSHPACGWIADG